MEKCSIIATYSNRKMTPDFVAEFLRSHIPVSGRALPRLARHPSAISSLLFSPSGRMVATVSWGFQCPVVIQVTEVAKGKELLRRLPDPDGDRPEP